MNYKLQMILIIPLLLSIPSLAMDNGYARIVYNVRGLQDYDLHWNDRFPPGSILKIYVESNGMNHRRAVAVDYIFIIKDTNDNIVETSSYSSRYVDYRENDFITYSREIPQDWDDGAYTAEIHVFDLLNESVMSEYYINLTNRMLNDSELPDLPIIERNDTLNVPNQYMEIDKIFYVDRYANKYPVDRFRVENIILDKNIVALKESVQVSANLQNSFYDPGSTNISLLLDGISIDNKTIMMEGYASQLVTFEVSSDIIGSHSVEIIPTAPDTMGLNLSAVFDVVTEKEIEKPTSFIFKDLQIDKLSLAQGETAIIHVRVENVGKEGSQSVELFINDKLEEAREVFINFSETKDVIFNITKTELGAYRVTIKDTPFSKIFFVESVDMITNVTNVSIMPIKEKKPELKYVIGLSIVIIFMIALRFYLKRELK